MRSFFHSSFRGPPAPVDIAQYARDVRDDTAELASYALSEYSASARSGRTASYTPSNIEGYFASNEDCGDGEGGDLDETPTPHAGFGGRREEAIEEVSEPPSPAELEEPVGGHSYTSAAGSGCGRSALTTLLRSDPPTPGAHLSTDYTTARESSGGSTLDDSDATANDTGTEVTVDEEAGRRRNGSHANERTPLIRTESKASHQRPNYLNGEHDLEDEFRPESASSWPAASKIISKQARKVRKLGRKVGHPSRWDKKKIWRKTIVEPAGFLPAVVLGALLNVLDALSYGMILFPLGEPLFEKLGPAGISMFYVSCIVSQLTFSFGGSIFKGGVGSEMIEVVPFFHKMAFTILATVGEDNPKAVISTTITSYAISSILTGLVFFLMGVCRFGYIVGFIPRHILIGCIGGVGWFLIATGLEVTARIDGNLTYTWDTLQKLFAANTAALWTIPLALGIFLYRSSKIFTGKYYLPSFILAIPAIFYIIVVAVPQLSVPDLREKGWVFAAPDADEPWWFFYTLYDFKSVHWGAVAANIPAMFALTFFGVLHVPINIPALAFNIGEDHLDLDRELVAHGLSNFVSGCCGSIQNYLVYTNSVLFIRSGGDSRLAGLMLAVATFFILLAGPAIIGFIPVMMVGVLIFVLGFELLFEAVWDPRHKLKFLEYATVIAIVLVMGIYDFVVGIFVGIGLAFVSLVVQTSRVPAVRASYSGEVAGSTVRRNPVQHDYLQQVSRQIHVTKLAGYLFFGTIVSVEARIRSLIDEEAFNHRPIRYLVFDLWHVTGIDYSAAEAFNRLNRIFSKKGVSIVMSGIKPTSGIGSSLRAVGLGQEGNEVRLLPDLNAALESCENELLKALYQSKEARHGHTDRKGSISHRSNQRSVPGAVTEGTYSPTMEPAYSSPRANHLHVAATRTLTTHAALPSSHHPSSAGGKYSNFREPLKLILQTFQGMSSQNEDLWHRATPYFKMQTVGEGEVLYNTGDAADKFYLIEEGILRADYDLPQGRFWESMVAGTTCGELPFFSEGKRSARVLIEKGGRAEGGRERVAKLWVLDREGWEKLQKEDNEVASELMRVVLKLTSERMGAITSYVLTTAG